MNTYRYIHLLAMLILFALGIIGCQERPMDNTPEGAINGYIAAVIDADSNRLKRFASSSNQPPNSLNGDNLRIMQKMVPIRFHPTNAEIYVSTANIHGIASFRDDWNTNQAASFQLIRENDEWKVDSFIIDVDDSYDFNAEQAI